MGTAAGIAGAAVSVAGSLIGGQAQSNQYAAEASRLRVAASSARLRAGETDLQYRLQQNEVENALVARRASENVGIDSPTGIALQDKVRERIGLQRSLAVGDQMMQAESLDQSAQLARSAGRAALTSGFVNAAGSAVKGAYSAATSPSFSTGISTLGATLSPLRSFFAPDPADDPRAGFASPSQRA